MTRPAKPFEKLSAEQRAVVRAIEGGFVDDLVAYWGKSRWSTSAEKHFARKLVEKLRDAFGDVVPNSIENASPGDWFYEALARRSFASGRPADYEARCRAEGVEG